MPAYNQDEVIDQVNQYLKSKRRKLKLEYGYCHGMTLLWLYKMSEGQEKWFYDLIKKIVSHKKKDFDDIEMDIEKFLNHIEWLQNSSEYTQKIQQLDIDKIFEIPRDLSLSFVFNSQEFSTALEKTISQNKMIVLSGPNHTIGVFKRGDSYYMFDPNYNEGEAKKFASISELKKEIVKSLFVEFKIATHLLPVTINVTDMKEHKIERISKMGMFKQMINTQKKANKVGPQGISPLYIACESGDEEEVKALLSKKIDIDHKLEDGQTALWVASQKGYANIVKRLLKYGADLNITNNDLISPLKAASEHGHDDVVTLLLNAKANIDLVDIDNESSLDVAADQNHIHVVKALLKNGAALSQSSKEGIPSLRHAIRNRNWDMAALILSYVKKMSELNASDLKLLRRNKKFVKDSIIQQLKLSGLVITYPLINSIFYSESDKETLFSQSSKKRKYEKSIYEDSAPKYKRRRI